MTSMGRRTAGSSNGRRSQWIVLIAIAATSLLLSSPVASQGPISFFGGVPAHDGKNLAADSALVRYLNQHGVTLEYTQRGSAGALLKTLVDLQAQIDRGEEVRPYLARITPYAYVAAKMMGVKFDLLATYESKATGSRTYHSYFVVNKEDFEGEFKNQLHRSPPNSPDLRDLHDYLESRSKRQHPPPTFVFHDQFSTSSYFLPALWFRSQEIFDMSPPTTTRLIAIHAQKAPDGEDATDLVQHVAKKEDQIAAVWDGAKAEFDPPIEAYKRSEGGPFYKEFGVRVLFIQLPNSLPNDLLVCSSKLSQDLKMKAITVIKKGIEINSGDFKWWTPIEEADEASVALTKLLALAEEPPAHVMVKVDVEAKYLEAVRQAIRRSGTEFVECNSDQNQTCDVRWNLRELEGDTVELLTSFVDPQFVGLAQSIPISFSGDKEQLTTRIEELIRSRMHRIRYIWPYWESYPTIIRDVDFAVARGTSLRVQRIEWEDPKNNKFAPGSVDYAVVDDVDSSKFKLSKTLSDYSKPMSNVAFRVVLPRQSYESTMTKVLTGVFLGLLTLGALGACLDLRRRPCTAVQETTETTVASECAELVAAYHARWRGRKLAEAEVLWCDRDQVDKEIQELIVQGDAGDLGKTVQRSWGWRASALPSFQGIGGGVEQTVSTVVLEDPTKVGNPVRLAALLDLMVERRLLSDFVGKPLEGEALNRIARRAIESAGQSESGGAEAEILKTDDELILGMVSKHFNQVLEDALNKVSLFSGAWTLTEQNGRHLASQRVPLSGSLRIGAEGGEVRGLVLEFELPEGQELPVTRETSGLDCWLLGKVVRRKYWTQDATPWLCLHFRAIAGLAGDVAGKAARAGFRRSAAVPTASRTKSRRGAIVPDVA